MGHPAPFFFAMPAGRKPATLSLLSSPVLTAPNVSATPPRGTEPRGEPLGSHWLLPLLWVTAIAAYYPALAGGMLWDDDAHVTRPALQGLDGLRRIWCDVGATQQYYPVLHTAFWVEHRLWADHVFGYHLLNVLLHGVGAWLLVRLLRRLSIPGAVFAGFVFALHPVMVESVAWIAEQKNTLSAVFYLGAALVYLEHTESRRRLGSVAAFVLFLLALLTKSVTATLPAGLLVVQWWRRGRLEWRRDVLPLVPWFLLAVPMGLFTAWVERAYIGALGSDFALTFGQRVLLAAHTASFYLGKLLWPANLMVIYPRWTLDPAATRAYGYVVIVVGLLAAALGLARRNRGPLAGLLFFLGTLFPALGFFNVYPFLFSYVADHFQYLASLGLIVPVAAGAATVAGRRLRGHRSATRWLAACALAPLGVVTWHEARSYRDSATLYRTTLARNPDCWLAHYNLAVLEEKAPGRLPDAIAHYRATLRLNPSHWAAHNNLGSALLHDPARTSEAVAEFRAALRLKPDFAEARNNLGVALSDLPGQSAGALDQFTLALRIRPNYAEARVNRANLLARTPGRMADAIADYEAALKTDPTDARAHYGLGNALARTPGRLDDAIAEFRVALRENPRFREAHNNLGAALARVPGKLDEAIEEYRVALRLDPGDAQTHANLGNALLRTPGRLSEAIGEYEAALRLAPDDADVHCSLGIALSDLQERWPDARREFETALRLRPNFPQAHYCLAVVLLRLRTDLATARAHLETAVRQEPDFTAARQLLARLPP